ncbi:MAG TPA: zinc ribbon domain-containing protein [Caldimonas sp.]|nr:zinc ribbon domain-containing protein [Caldimonas sp.]
MPTLKNFRDVPASTSDLGAGFQFEFFCERCGETWRSPFKAYRKGQLTGLLSRSSALTQELGGWLSGVSRTVQNIYRASRGVGAFADAGSAGARAEAQAEAIALAKDRYHCCDACQKWVGDECFDERSGLCLDCAKGGSQRNAGQGGGALACPNCQTPSQGGRFCAECGFDMASTHKSCPSCGATQPREARFCGDCGHGF